MKLTIGYFYPDHLNLYGDNGNVEILLQRARWRGIDTALYKIKLGTVLNNEIMSHINLIFMGGGPDSQQKSVYEDLLHNKGVYLREYIENDGVGLFICGSYQLLGKYYQAADGSKLEGLGIFDLYTQHFGNHKPRCIGNVVSELNTTFRHDPVFNHLNKIGTGLVGFENHGGRTYLGESAIPLAKIIRGYGNNGETEDEGITYKNSIGTYLHGPILSKNPHLADYLIATAINKDELAELDDNLIKKAHYAAKELPQ